MFSICRLILSVDVPNNSAIAFCVKRCSADPCPHSASRREPDYTDRNTIYNTMQRSGSGPATRRVHPLKFVLSTFMTPVAELLALAPVAEDSGWDAISFSDHIVHPEQISTPYPYTEDGTRRWEAFTDWPDPMVMAAALAAVTRRIRLTNNLFVLPVRNPFLVAKAAGTVAVLSGNRLTLAIGIGWSRDEFELMQQDFHTRGRRADEMVEIMRKLWSGKMVEHQGRHYRFGRLEMNPAPSAQPPLWVGGISDAALRRAARLGDGWVSDWQSGDEITACIEQVQAYRREAVRDDAFDVMATPSDVFDLDGYRRLEKKGVTHILFQPYAFDASLEDKKQALRDFAAKTISRCR